MDSGLSASSIPTQQSSVEASAAPPSPARPTTAISSSSLSSPPSTASLRSLSYSSHSVFSASDYSSEDGEFPNNLAKSTTVKDSHGTVFDAWPIASRPDAPVMGTVMKDGTRPRTRKDQERMTEACWQTKRKEVIEERMFSRLNEDDSRCDYDGSWHFETPLPEWLNAVREIQEDGALGTFLVQPSYEDFRDRFVEMLDILEPFGMRLGALKVKVPEEWLDKPIPYTDFLPKKQESSEDVTPEVEPVRTKKRGRKPKKCGPRKKHTSGALTSSSNSDVSRSSSTAPDKPDPTVFIMAQHLPIHENSIHRGAPIYEVISKLQEPVPLSTFPHELTSESTTHRIPEDQVESRGRSWRDIAHNNPGGAVYYSSDNDASPILRSVLGLGNPKFKELPGNEMDLALPRVQGIHTPYLYLGNPYTMFALHQEDYCALSLNYHHAGAPKVWRITSPLDFALVEDLVKHTCETPPEVKACSQHVRHESLFVSRGAFQMHGVRSILVRQQQGEMVITWPLAYHQGWNEGGNICEAIAYGTTAWRNCFVDAIDAAYRPCGRRCQRRGMGIGIELEFASGDEDVKFQRGGNTSEGNNGGLQKG
ncbi:JmjC domain, hydroxylase-domain-containing protein [Pyronema omphalodes]|nr:JmjC domain, hydroxylase-domain-containing protein [Pyronema omphalodes]KAI5817979.1 JmjC domain, hydroxylase-domain-containing protein [Pyronema omphalodes]